MKKELIAAVLIVIVIAGSLVNTYFLCRLSDELVSLIDGSAAAAASGDWETAVEQAESAASLWSGRDAYTHIILRHTEINAATDAIYQLLMHTYSENPGEAKGAAEMAKDHFKSIASMEQIRFGSIF